MKKLKTKNNSSAINTNQNTKYNSSENNASTKAPKDHITQNMNIYFHLANNHLAIIYPFKSISMDINIEFIKQQTPIKLIHCLQLILINLPNTTQNTFINIHSKINNLTSFYTKQLTIQLPIPPCQTYLRKYIFA